MDDELRLLEDELRKFSPSPVSGDVLSRMVEAMDRWQDHAAEADNVVAFPAFPVAQEDQSGRRGWHPTWAAAAAVAVLGGFVGLALPSNENSEVVALAELGQVPAFRQASFAPVNTSSNIKTVSSTMYSDERGVPYQVIRISREEEANFEGTGQVGLKISKPKVETYVVPVTY